MNEFPMWVSVVVGIVGVILTLSGIRSIRKQRRTVRRYPTDPRLKQRSD